MSDQTARPERDEDRPFTSDERKELRAILENDRRAKWFWATIRIWAGWLSAVAAFVLLLKRELIK
ncbi:MAG: hypothetical protein HZY79_00485 [Rhodoblastus sp.]|nr:MAG: hypothetical protein HZY79_00485 [Rhodoblastus sp.]